MRGVGKLLVLAVLQGINVAQCRCGFFCPTPNIASAGGLQPKPC